MFDRRTLRVLFTIVAFAVVLWLVYAAGRMLLIFVFAVLFAYLLQPMVDHLERWLGGSRLRGIAVTYLILLGVVATFVLTVGPAIMQQGQHLAVITQAGGAAEGAQTLAHRVGEQQGLSARTLRDVDAWVSSHRTELTRWLQLAGLHAATVAANAGWLFLIPILAFFVLRDKSSLGDALLHLVESDGENPFWRAVVRDLDRMLAQYIRAQLMLSFFAFVAFAIALGLLQFPYFLALAAMAGLLEFIPIVGPFLAALVILGVGLLSDAHWLWALGFVLVWRGIQDYVNTPYIMGEGLELHPLAAIFGILVGGEVGGIIGMYLSIPVLAAVRIIWRNWHLRQPVPRELRKDIA